MFISSSLFGRVTYDVFLTILSPISILKQTPAIYPCKSLVPLPLIWKSSNSLVEYTTITLTLLDLSFACSSDGIDLICHISQHVEFKNMTIGQLVFYIARSIIQTINISVTATCPEFRSIVPTLARASGGTPLYLTGGNYSNMTYSLFFTKH